MHNYENLKVWQHSIQFVSDIYNEVNKNFPSSEKFGLSSQICRAAVSIPCNIAEGSGRSSNKEFAYFLSVSIASSFEVYTQLLIAFNLKYIPIETLNNLKEKLFEIQKMLRTLINKFR